MDQQTRTNLEALFREHFRPRRDGGLDFTLDDHLYHMQLNREHGISTRQWCEIFGLPINYGLTLEAALKQAQQDQ